MGTPETDVGEVTVSGPAEKVAAVSQAVGSVSVEGLSEDVDQAVRLEPRDDLGNLVDKLILDPRIVTVKVAIEQTTFSRPVAVSPVVTGVPETGYNIVAVSSNPLTVTIRGEQASIREITTISTQPVSVDGEDQHGREDRIAGPASGRKRDRKSERHRDGPYPAAQGTVRFTVPVDA